MSEESVQRSIHEYCPSCGSANRESSGIEANIGLPDVALWHCNNCYIVYDGPVPPYELEPSGIDGNVKKLLEI